MVEIYAKDKLTLVRTELAHNHKMGHGIPHGVEGHTGYRCGSCALTKPGAVQVQSDSSDHWQTKQIEWQEECDKIFREFDVAVAAHWPVHLPVNCQDCPVTAPLPPKPTPPQERTWVGGAKDTGWK